MANFRVKDLCRQKGITLADLAEDIKMSPSALSRTLSVGNPNLHTMEKIAEALGVDFIDIFERQKPTGHIIYKDTTYSINDVQDIEDVLTIIKNDK